MTSISLLQDLMPDYVERGGEVVYRQPFRAIGVRMCNFVLRGDIDALRVLYDRYFNEVSGRAEDLGPAGPYFILSFASIPELIADQPPDAQLGTSKETEAVFWLPAVDRQRDRLVWAMPYIFVDNSWATAGGRETYGFPKQQSTVVFERSDRPPPLLTVDTLALETYSASSVAANRRVLTVHRPADAGGQVHADWADLDGARRELAGRAGLSDHVDRMTEVLLRVPDLFTTASAPAAVLLQELFEDVLHLRLLKQFRDSENPAKACYQAIVDAPFHLLGFRGGGFLPDDYEVDVADLASEPIRRELGLPPGVLRPELSYWLEFDFLIDRGRTLWKALVV